MPYPGNQLKKEEIEVLIKRIKQGDESALSQIYNYYAESLYRYIYRQVGSREEAEDLTSEVFLKMIKSLGSFAFESSFKTWLWGLAYHAIMDYWRKHYRLKTNSLDLFFDLGEEPKERSFNEEDIERESIIAQKKVEEILNNLPPNYRQVLELRFLKNYSLKETAREMNVSLNNAKVLQFRALKKAREMTI